MNLYGYEFQRDSDLVHYGVIGMKWGVRRYQNADGTLTAEGRKRAKSEYRSDNKKAFELGKKATISARAHQIALQKLNKANAKYEKNPSYKNLEKKSLAERLESEWAEQKDNSAKEVDSHFNELIQKYGSDAVSSVIRDASGNINESVHDWKDYGVAAGMSLWSAGMSMALQLPVSMVFFPQSKNSIARDEYYLSKLQAKNAIAKKKKEDSRKSNDKDQWEPAKNGNIFPDKYKENLKANKAEMLERARTKDLFNLDYLEMRPDDMPEHQILKDYEKFLDDPDKYAVERYKR